MNAKQAEAAHLERELARMSRARDQMASLKAQRQAQVAALASGYQAVAGGVKMVSGLLISLSFTWEFGSTGFNLCIYCRETCTVSLGPRVSHSLSIP